MGLIIFLTPLFIYYFFIVPIIKIKILNKKIKNKKYRRVFFIFLLLLPFTDYIIGYATFKSLCKINANTSVYEKVINREEQKKFWFSAFKDNYPQNLPYKWHRYGIKGNIYLTKDLQQHRLVFWKECKTQKFNNYDCRKIEKDILKHNIDIYKKKSHDKKILLLFNKYGKHYKLSTSYLIEKDSLIPTYINECNKQYDSLPKSLEKFKDSCKYTYSFIEKNNLLNVIKVPKSKYIVEDKNNYLYPLLILKKERLIKDITKNKTISKKISYNFYGGLYFNIFSPYKEGHISCNENSNLKKVTINNPYKNESLKI